MTELEHMMNLVQAQSQYLQQLSQQVSQLASLVREQQGEQLMTVREAARFIGISEPQVRNLCAQGIIGHVRVNERDIRIPVRMLNQYIESKLVKPDLQAQQSYHPRPAATLRGQKRKSA